MTLAIQWLTIAVMLTAGIGMGAVFDGYRVVSNELKFPRWWLPFLDIMYWIAAALVVFRMLYASNNGEVRAYVFLGLALGVLIYYWLLNRIVVSVVRWLIRAVQTLVRIGIRIVELIIVKPSLFLYNILKFVIGIGSALTIFLIKLVLQLLRPFSKLLAWLLKPIWRPIERVIEPKWQIWKQACVSSKLASQVLSWKSRLNNWLRRK